MKRIILFLPLLLLTYVNLQAGNKDGGSALALVADFTASVTSGCVSLTTQFTSTSTSDASDPIVSYSWDFGDGSPVSITTNTTITHTYIEEDFYTVSLTVKTQSGNTITEIKDDYIWAGEKPEFSFGPDYSKCDDGKQVTLSTTTGAYVYTWSDAAITTWRANFKPKAGVNTYWAKVDNNGCVTADTIIITVKPLTTPNFGYNVVSSCSTVTVQFTDSTIFDATCSPGPTYEIDELVWEFDEGGDEVSGLGGSVTHDFSTGGNHTVTLYVYNKRGESKKITKTINIPNPTPGPTPIDLGGDKTICIGNSIQLDAGNEPGATYVWSPATGLSSTAIYNPIASPTSTQTYTVTKTKCGISTPPASVTVNVAPALVVDLGPDTDFCGGFVLLDAGVAGATSYKWGSTYLPSYYASQNKQTTKATGAGKYWVTVTKNGCTASDTIVLHPKKAVTAAFDLTSSGSGSCGPYTVNVVENSVMCLGSVSDHRWDFGDGTVVTGFNQSYSHSYSVPGTYKITLIVTTDNNDKDTIPHNVSFTGSAFTVNLGNDTTICAGNSITLDAGPGASYSWNTGASTQTITVTPTVNTPYIVTVTNASGCTGTGSKTVNVASALVVDLGPDTDFCGGFVLLDAGVAGATSYKWGSTYLPSYYASQNKQTTKATGAGKYWVTVTKNGCTASDTIVLHPKKAVTAAFDLTSSGSGSCGPYTVNVVENSVMCLGSVSDHRWDFGDGTVVTGFNQSYSHSYSVPGTYKITLIVTTDNNDKDTIPHNVSFTGSAFTVNLGNDTTLCTGSSLTLNAGNTGATYAWTNITTGQSIGSDQTLVVNASGDYAVEVSNGMCKARDTVKVMVTGALNINLGNDTTICPLNSITLDAGNYPGATYLWSSNIGNGHEGTQTVTVSPDLETNVYSVTVTQGACSGTGTIKVFVNAALPVHLGNDTAICSGSYITLDAGYPTATSWLWNDGQVSQTNTVHKAGTYKVTVTYNGCSGEDSIKIGVIEPPAPVSLGNDINLCFGNSVLLDAGDYTGVTYLWSTGETTRTITVTSSGNYKVTVSGCGAPVSDDINVTLSNLATPTITQSGLELVCSQADSYQWYKDGVLIPGATSQRYKPRGYGNYSVVVSNTALGCTGVTADYWFVPAGDFYLGDIRVKITPNPSAGQTRLVLSKLPGKPIKVTIYDRVGRRLVSREVVNKVTDINMSMYAKGLYFVECILDNDRIILPLVTQ